MERLHIGARCAGDNNCEFVVWAPRCKQVSVRITGPEQREIPLSRSDRGYWHACVEDLPPGARYVYCLDNDLERPDPAAHFQPDGVHGPSATVDHSAFLWHDRNWRCPPLKDMIMYELHVGAFTPEGTFEAAAGRLDDLKELGINAISVMPVAQFPGSRNWGYDGVYPFAVQNSYGGPTGLKKLVDAAHQRGIAVILDVVYNHLGPEGNYFHAYGPYFTDKYRTPWGEALNYDGPHSDEVRNYFIENALHWFENYHVDGLRLDAIHGIFDMSARPFLQELAEKTDRYANENERPCYLIAESDLNDARIIRPRDRGGFGLPAQWSDDFHHSLHTLLTGETAGYYQDFGTAEHLAAALRQGYVYDGRYSAYRRRQHGNDPSGRTPDQFVISTQTHDQVGNRMLGDRLSTLVPLEGLKLAAGAMLLSANVPMLFMGEEYAEEAPFLYFVSHGDTDLIEAVREGRKEEFRAFGWKEDPPDPQDDGTFRRSILNWQLRSEGTHAVVLAFYRELISLRRSVPALAEPAGAALDVISDNDSRTLRMRRGAGEDAAAIFMNFNTEQVTFIMQTDTKRWRKRLDSTDRSWQGPGASMPDLVDGPGEVTLPPLSLVLYLAEDRS